MITEIVNEQFERGPTFPIWFGSVINFAQADSKRWHTILICKIQRCFFPRLIKYIVFNGLSGVFPISFSYGDIKYKRHIQLTTYDWYNKGRGMCYRVCGMVHIKNPCC